MVSGNKKFIFDGLCRQYYIVYELICKITGKSYIDKTQRYLKERTLEHVAEVWSVISAGRENQGENWRGSGGYASADSFAKNFVHLCRDWKNSNEVRAFMKENLKTKIIWQGDPIQCMKTSRTMQCKLCMKERREILARFDKDRNSIINDNSDIFSSCKCKSSFHKFFRTVTTSGTEDAFIAEKSQCFPIGKKSKKKRFSFSNIPFQTQSQPVTPDGSASSSQEETVSPNLVTPFFLTPTFPDSHIGVPPWIPQTWKSRRHTCF